MAAVQQLLASPSPSPGPTHSVLDDQTPVSVGMDVDMDNASNGSIRIDSGADGVGAAPREGDRRIVVIVYANGEEHIVSVFSEVLGMPTRLKHKFREVVGEDRGFVVGLPRKAAMIDVEDRDQGLLVAIHAHAVDSGARPDSHLSAHCDYEFLYAESPYLRRDLTRFISFTLGQTSPHAHLMAKPRTFFISTTFPDVRAALPNIDILTVGSDAVEIRVDLLQEPCVDGSFSRIPSLSYVGDQVMLLRQRTELPIIFTTRCTNENGRFPMEDPDLYYHYLYKAIQWGIEYIDVELWLPERLRRKLWEMRGNSRIMSAFHDFSGTFKWSSPYATDVFQRSRRYADIIKMIAIINEPNENFELEYFRSKMKADYPDAPPLSAVNMDEVGQFSRTVNTVFTPITHPLLPMIAAPGQMSTAEINGALALLGHLPKKYFYGISNAAARSVAVRAPFYEKCFNELGLPHLFSVVERQHNSPSGIQAWCDQKDFGGAYLDPGLSLHMIMKHNPFFSTLRGGQGPVLSEAAAAIGIIDTILVRPGSLVGSPISQSNSSNHAGDGVGSLGQAGLPPNTSLVFDNAGWRGILSTLTRDLAPSAYYGRTAVVLALTSDDAAPVFYAMKALKISKIYTVGFRTPAALACNAPPIEQFISMESLQRARSVADNRAPFVMVSALGRGKSNLVNMLIRVFGAASASGASSTSKKVFLNMANAATLQENDPVLVAEKSGFTAYDAADVAAFTTVESLRLLVGQNVPYSFVRLAGGRTLF